MLAWEVLVTMEEEKTALLVPPRTITHFNLIVAHPTVGNRTAS